MNLKILPTVLVSLAVAAAPAWTGAAPAKAGKDGSYGNGIDERAARTGAHARGVRASA